MNWQLGACSVVGREKVDKVSIQELDVSIFIVCSHIILDYELSIHAISIHFLLHSPVSHKLNVHVIGLFLSEDRGQRVGLLRS